MRRMMVWLLALFGLAVGSATAAEKTAAERFHEAVHRGDIATVKSLLAADGTLATSSDRYRFQPIHLLDMDFEPEILDLLLRNGADINARNDEGVTLLHIVTDPAAVAPILAKGADIEARDSRGWTPLVMQANNQQNGPEVVAALLAAGADPNARGNRGETALSFARETGDAELLQLLTKAGAKD